MKCGAPISGAAPVNDADKPAEPAPKVSAKPAKEKKESSKDPSQKSNTGIIIGIIAGVAVLPLVVALVILKPWQTVGTTDTPVADNTQETTVAGPLDTTGSTASTETAAEETAPAKEYSEAELSAIFSEGDALLNDGQTNANAGEYQNAMVSFASAINSYTAKADAEPDLKSAADAKIATVFPLYTDSILNYNAFLFGQYLNGGLYVQARNTLDEALAFGADLQGKGYSVDMTQLQDQRNSLVAIFREKYMTAFNEFTTRENWSRDEAWSLMEDAYNITEADGSHSLFELSDLDDPLVRRYHYAYAYSIRKNAEKSIAEGVLSEADAASQLISVLPACDYNMLVMYDAIIYGERSGADTSAVASAFTAMQNQLLSTQNISLTTAGTNNGSYVDINHFWYFNDFNSGLTDEFNGVTTDNMHWIRENIPAYLQ